MAPIVVNPPTVDISGISGEGNTVRTSIETEHTTDVSISVNGVNGNNNTIDVTIKDPEDLQETTE